jgi:hypothetical protein
MRPSTPSTSNLRLLRTALATTVVLLAVLHGVALAAGPTVLVRVHQRSGVASTYFQLRGRAGTTVRAGTLELVNPTAARIAVRLDPVDGITTDTLGSAYRLRGAAIHGPTRWLRIEHPAVTIPPHGHVQVPVSLAVPHSAKPGDYLAGVAVEALHQVHRLNRAHGLAIGETDRYGVGVELSIPGPRHPLVRFTGARLEREPSGLAFLLLAHNPGNVILKNAHGWALVTQGDRRVAAETITPGTFVTGSAIQYPVPARAEQPREGTRYRVRAKLYYQGGVAYLDTLVVFGHRAAVTQQLYGGPKASSGGWFRWWFGVIAAAALLLLLVGYTRRRRRRPLALAAAIALLERELATGRELSVVHIALGQGSRSARRELLELLRGRVRPSDRICDLEADGLLIVLPATGAGMASAFASDLSTLLDGSGLVESIGAASAAPGMEALDLLANAKGGREGGSNDLDELNLTVPESGDRGAPTGQ